MFNKPVKRADKKGQLTAQQIAVIIIAIIGFAIVLFFVTFLFDDSGETDRELCRLSVLTRATAPDIAQAVVPLKCKTEKICITSKLFGGKCKQFAGEDNVQIMKVKTVEEIDKIMADHMYYCWSMMGQGKLDLFAKATGFLGLAETGKATCVVCSRVALAEDIIQKGWDKEIGLTAYLQNNFVPGAGNNLKYLEAFTDKSTSTFSVTAEVEKLVKSEAEVKIAVEKGEGSGLVDRSSTNIAENGNQIAFVFSQNKPTKWSSVLGNWGAVTAGSFFTVSGFFRKILIPVDLGLAAAGTLNTYAGQRAAVGYCGTFVSSLKNRDIDAGGCSLIQAVPYKVSNVNAVCNSIQSIP